MPNASLKFASVKLQSMMDAHTPSRRRNQINALETVDVR